MSGLEFSSMIITKAYFELKFNETAPTVLEGTHSDKIKDMEFKELLGTHYTIRDITVGWDKLPDDIKKWADAEFVERVARRHINPGEAWKLRPSLEKFIEANGRFSYSYNERYSMNLSEVIDQLGRRPSTRQAILPIFIPGDLYMEGSRIPCTIMSQFIIRDDKVHQILYSRSVNFERFWLTDLYLHYKLQRYIANAIGRPIGTFTHTIGSFHIVKEK